MDKSQGEMGGAANGVRYDYMRHAAKELCVAHSTIKAWCNNINGCYNERKYK